MNMNKNLCSAIDSILDDLHDEVNESVEICALTLFEENETAEAGKVLGVDLDTSLPLSEALEKHVSSTGEVTKTRSRAVRSRHATKTTGLSRRELKVRARKAAKTRKRSSSSLKKAIRKRAKALKKRKSMGLNNR